MAKVTIIVELADNKVLNVTGPLEHDRQLCIDMLAAALKVAQTYTGSALVLPTPGKFVELSRQHQNHQIRQEL
jgi:hypothetical protein